MKVGLRKTVGQVLHGCRQFVSWDVPLIRVTNATLALCFTCHRGLPEIIGRKARMTPNQHGPWCPGLHTWYNGRYNGLWSRKMEDNPTKAGLSSDWGLKLALMKLELLVIANQLRGDEYVPESCTQHSFILLSSIDKIIIKALGSIYI